MEKWQELTAECARLRADAETSAAQRDEAENAASVQGFADAVNILATMKEQKT